MEGLYCFKNPRRPQNMHTPVYITSHTRVTSAASSCSDTIRAQMTARRIWRAQMTARRIWNQLPLMGLSLCPCQLHARRVANLCSRQWTPTWPWRCPRHGHRLSGTCPGWPASCTWRWPSCRRCLSWPTKRQKWLWCRQKLAPAVCHPGLRRCAGQRGCGPEFAAVGMVAAHQNEEMPRQGAN